MMVDMQLFAWLAVGVAVVGAFLWLKPNKAGKVNAKLKRNQSGE